MNEYSILGPKFIADPWRWRDGVMRPSQVLDELRMRRTEGGDDAFIAYLMHLRFDGARHDMPGTTHEIGMFIYPNPEALAFTLQLKLRDDAAARQLFDCLIQGACHGNLPISKLLRSSEVARWEEVANHVISAVRLGEALHVARAPSNATKH